MEEYTKSSRYMLDEDNIGLCFGFTIDELSEGEEGFDVKMFYSDTIFIQEQQNMPSQLDPAADPFIRAPNELNYQLHTSQGFSYI